MTIGLTCMLLVLDLAVFVVLRRKLREKNRARTIVSIACILLAAALAGYLALTALFLDAAYHK